MGRLRQRDTSGAGTSAAPAVVFVSGVKKSGTNWVAGLLGTHPDVVVTGELHLEQLRDTLRAYAKPDWVPVTQDEVDDVLQPMLAALLERHRATCCAACGRSDRGAVLVDHTPGAVELHLGPAARYIHVVRDPRDVLVADAFHSMRLGEYPPEVEADQRDHVDAWRRDRWYFTEHPTALLHPVHLDLVIANWVAVVTASLERAQRHPDVVTVVRYEDLHHDVLGRRDELLCAAGLDPAAARPIPPELRPAFGGRDEDPHAFLRHGVVGDHRTYLSSSQEAQVDACAGPLMARMGYR